MNEMISELVSINSLSSTVDAAISAMPCQDGIVDSARTLAKRTQIAQSIGRSLIHGNNSVLGEDQLGSDRTDIVLQMSPKEPSRRLREAFNSRLKIINEPDVGYFLSNTEFLGEVQSVDADKSLFSAIVRNRRNPDDCYSAEFNMDEVPSSDRVLVTIGALFFWEVGREITNGTERNVSQICFRRMASIGKRQLSKLEKNAKEESESIRRAIAEE